MIRTLLLTAPVKKELRYTTGLEKIANVLPPLGLAYIAAMLEKKNIPVEVIDAEALQLDMDNLIERIAAQTPDLIGISCMTMYYNACIRLARQIKQKFPSIIIVLGGPHPSIFPEEILKKYDEIDIVAIGEGEHTIVELVTALDKKSPLDKIKGIAYRQNGKAHLTAPRNFETNLDIFPYPAWHKFPLKKYSVAPQWYSSSQFMTIIASRGCPFNCTFCSKSVFGSLHRRRSPRNVVGEIEVLKEKYAVKDVSFVDDTFNLDRAWVDEFCDLMIKKNIGVTWSCESRVDTVSAEALKKMRSAGCWNIFYGIETGSQVILDNICKGVTLEQVRKAVRWAKEAGLEIQASFMLALPQETPKTAMETIKFAIELDCDYTKFNITSPFPGTELYQQALRSGRLSENLDGYTTQHPVFIPYGYKDEEHILRMKKKAFRMFYIRPKYIVKRILRIRSFADIKKYLKAFKGFLAIVKG